MVRVKTIIGLVAIAFALMFVFTASEDTYADDSGTWHGFEWEFNEGTNELTISGTGDMPNRSDADPAPWEESYKSSIKTVTIEDGITCIGSNLFYGYSNLATVNLSETVTSINENSFCDCTDLESINLSNVITLGYNSFYGCTSLTSVSLPKATSIAHSAFRDCTNLANVAIPVGIDVYASGSPIFKNTNITTLTLHPSSTTAQNYTADQIPWKNVTSVTIMDGVTKIGNYMFAGCTSLVEIDLCNCERLGSYTFSNCSNLQTVTFVNDKLKEIPQACFSNCSELDNFDFTKLTSIGLQAFMNCTSLTSVSLPFATSIGSTAFGGCSALESISIPEVTTISNATFRGCTSLESVSLPKVTSLGEEVFLGCTALASIELPLAVTIGNYMFQGCTSLTSVSLPSATSIGTTAFKKCTALTSIELPLAVTIGASVFDGCTYLASVSLPKVTSLGSNAFKGCTALTNVTIPIELDATHETPFNDCTNISSFTFVAAGEGEGCVYKSSDSPCYSQTPWYRSTAENVSITFGDGVVSIGEYMFFNCSKVTSVDFSETVKTISYRAFDNSGVIELDLTHVESFGELSFANCTKLTNLILPIEVDVVVSKDNPAFNNSTNVSHVEFVSVDDGVSFDYSLDSKYTKTPWYISTAEQLTVVLGDGTVSISDSMFYGCSNINSITIPDTLTSIGAYSFAECEKITEIDLSNVETIGSNAFYNCSEIETLDLSSAISIGEDSFCSCTGLTSITVPIGLDTVVSISNCAFNECVNISSVTLVKGPGAGAGISYYENSKYTPWYISTVPSLSITIGEGVVSIGTSTFEGCDNITSVSLPGTLTSIEFYVFRGCGLLTEIDLKNTTHIGNYVFAACTELSSIDLSKVTHIGDWVFHGCIGITEIDLSFSSNVGQRAFYNCTSLVTAVLPIETDLVKDHFLPTFQGCVNLKNITLVARSTGVGFNYDDSSKDKTPWAISQKDDIAITISDGVTEIGDYTFYEFNKSESMTIPDSVVSVGDYAFYGRTVLTDIPDGLTSVGDYAFYGCDNITSIDLSDVTEIGDYAFYGCSALTEVIMPTADVTIGEYAFYGCESLETIDLSHVTSIGANAFSGCTSLTEVDLSSATTIGDYAFDGCSGITKITVVSDLNLSIRNEGYDPETDPDNTGLVFRGCVAINDITLVGGTEALDYEGNANVYKSYDHTPWALTEAESISVTIGDDAYIGRLTFYNCTKMTSLTILKSSKMGMMKNAFEGCTGVTSLTIPVQFNATWFTIGSSLTNVTLINGSGGAYDYKHSGEEDAYTNTPWYKSRDSLVSVTIEEGVTTIGKYTFRGCDLLTAIELPDSLTTIGNHAFYGCTGLKFITGGSYVTNIENYAFNSCRLLESVEFSSLTTIGDSSFYNCNYLESIDLSQVTTIGVSAFKFCNSLESIDLSHVTTIGASAFESCVSLTELDLSSATSIGDCAFMSCSSLESVEMFSENLSYITIGDYAFKECKSLVQINPFRFTTIGEGAFASCTAIEEIDLYYNHEIGNSAFYNCSGLKSVTLYNTTEIGDNAFDSCKKLESIDLKNVITIGEEAFMDCIKLKEANLNSASTIGHRAFYNAGLVVVKFGDMDISSYGDDILSDCYHLVEIHVGNNDNEQGCISYIKGHFDVFEEFDYGKGYAGCVLALSSDDIYEIGVNAQLYAPSDVINVYLAPKIAKNTLDVRLDERYVEITWYTNDGRTTAWDFENDVVSDGTIIYASFKKNIDTCEIEIDYDGGEGYVFTNSDIEPVFVVRYDGNELVKDTDYTIISGGSGKNVGVYTLELQGMGDYSGTLTAEWEIIPLFVDDVTIKIVNAETKKAYYNNGNPVTFDDVQLEIYKDGSLLGIKYEHELNLEYSNNYNVGDEATITLRAFLNYVFEATTTFEIQPIEFPGQISDISNQYYTGSPIKPDVTFTSYSEQVGDDYEVSYQNNCDAGTAKIIVEFNGNYTGFVEKTFTILPKALTDEMVQVNAITYTGSLLTVDFDVSDDGGLSKEDLILGDTYTATNVGNYEFSLTAKENTNYSGTIHLEWSISPMPLADEMITITSTLVYDGSEKTVAYTVTNGSTTLVLDTDYTTTSDLTKTDAGDYTITITGKGNYTGTAEKGWSISPMPLTEEMITITSGSFTYDGDEKTVTYTVTNGSTTLVLDTDYTTTSDLTKTNAGDYTITITGNGNYSGTAEKEWIISPKTLTDEMVDITSGSFAYDGSEKTVIFTVTDGEILTEGDWTASGLTATDAGNYMLVVEGKGNYTGTVQKQWIISPKTLTDEMVKITSGSFVYDGSEKTVIFTVTDDSTSLVQDTDYTVTSNITETNANTYTLVIAGKGNYAGTVEKQWTISKSNAMTVTATGYKGTYDGVEHFASATSSVVEGTTLYYSVDGGKTWKTIAPSIKDSGGVSFKVKAVNSNYEDAFDTKTLEVGLREITLKANGAEKKYGQKDPTFVATPSWFYEGDTPLKYTITRADGENVGHYELIVSVTDAIQGNYLIAGLVKGEFVINKSDSLTVNADDYCQPYDGQKHYVVPVANDMNGTTFMYSTDGGSSWSDVVPFILDNGEITVKVKAVNSNYEDAICECNMEVERRKITVTADDITKVYGDADPELTVTISWIHEGDVLLYNIERQEGEGCGVYNILFPSTEPIQHNYEIDFVYGKFTITQAPLTITANDMRINAGDDPPTSYTARYDGFKFEDDESVLSGLDITCDYDKDELGRVFEIIPSGATASNYDITFVNGYLYVGKIQVVRPVPEVVLYTYNGQPQTFRLTVHEDYVIINNNVQTNVGTYTVTVSLKDSENSEWSTAGDDVMTFQFVINPKEVVVTADNISKIYGQDDPVLTATVDGVVDEYVISYSPLTREAGENVGDYDITVTGDEIQGNYVVRFVTGKLTITPSDAMGVTATAYTGTYDGVSHGISVVTSVEEGTTLYYSEDDGVNWTEVPFTLTDVGSLNVKVKAVNSNYFDVVVESSITITHKEVTVTADNKTKVYGESDPSLTVTVDGVVDEYVITYLPLTREAGENVDTYDIYVTGAGTQGNYAISFVKGTLTITKAPLTITADEQHIKFNDPIPTYTASFSGFVLDDDESVLTGTLAFTCGYVVGSPNGTYQIVPSGLSSLNYNISFVEGTLIVGTMSIDKPTASDVRYEYNGQEQTYLPVGDLTHVIISGNTQTNAGTYQVTVSLPDESFEWSDGTTESFTLPFVIHQIELADSMISISGEYTYNGSEQTVQFTVTDGETSLTENVDWKVVSGNKGTDANTYTLKIEAVEGANYCGNAEKTWSISKVELTGTIDNIASQTYTGSEIRPSVSISGVQTGATYSETYTNNVNVGTATVTVEGTGNYYGTLTKNFTIVSKALSNDMISISGEYIYNESEQTVQFTVTDGERSLIVNVDWKVVSGNKGTDRGDYTLRIEGIGNYSGEASKSWSIIGSVITGTIVNIPVQNYSGIAIEPEISIDGIQDDATYDITYENNVNAGTATVIVTGTGLYSGTLTKNFTIAQKRLTSSMVSVTETYLYDGNEHTVQFTVTDGERSLIENIDWKVESGNKGTESGEYSLTLLGIGNYTETVIVKWVIEAVYPIDDDGKAEIEKEVMEEWYSKADSDPETKLELSSDDYTIEFDAQSILELGADALTLSFNKLSKEEMGDDLWELTGGRPVYDISLGEPKSFGDGTVTITIPYELKDGENPDYLKVYYISQGKVEEVFACTYANGFVTFVTNHLSNYGIGYETPVESSSGGNILPIILIVFGVAMLAVAGVFFVKKKSA